MARFAAAKDRLDVGGGRLTLERQVPD